MSTDENNALTRLEWRCRRGMRELDILMSRYLKYRYEAASPEEQAAFRRLLELPDPELVALLFRQIGPADDPTARVLDDISPAH